ncbi:tRNA uracil 4-sulfurtransferase ThiI [Methanothermobacter wolfeii]|uniref:tRNA uracil 4-sulfurtransferase ThiI n=1 Tax=Methanothermobacter wolfeii TaxID=145261 RepID=UPI003D164086
MRRRFEKKLVHNIRSALDCRATVRNGRIFIYPDNMEEALEGLSKIFGLVSFSPAVTTETEFESIEDTLRRYTDELRSEGLINTRTTFAVRCRRTGQHEFTSQEMAAFAGSVILKNTGASVDLGNPDMEIHIEVRDQETYIYHRVIPGPGGLPAGTQGKVVALLSGGIDSPVAAYLMMRRGCQVIALHMDNTPFTSPEARDKTEKIAEKLAEYSAGVEFKFRTFSYGEYLEKCRESGPERMTCVLCKLGMYTLAEMVAREEGALAIVDGSSLGQVASQTLPNLFATRMNVEMPVLSPLIGMDKVEIEDLARKIGTYDISIIPDGGCSAVPAHPSTAADPQRVLDAARDIDLKNEIIRVLESGSERIM